MLGFLLSWFVYLPERTVSMAEARRIHLTPEQQAQLANANSVLITVLALTEKGPADHYVFSKPLRTRLQEFQYTVDH